MATTFADHYAELLTAAAQRRGTAILRGLFGVAIAAVLHLKLGWSWIWLWAAAYGVSQALEFVVLRPAMLARWSAPTRGRAAGLLATMLLPAALYAPLAIPIWNEAQYGPVLAVLLLASGGLNLLVSSGPSVAAFFGPFTVYGFVWLLLVVNDHRLSAMYRQVGAVLAVLVATNCVVAWRIQAKALRRARLATEEADQRRREFETAVEAKGVFVAMISHDLRTPLGAILAGADKIERGGEGARRYAKVVREAGVMMRDLLGDLLDMERIDAGAMPVEQITFDLRQTIAEALGLWRADAAQNGLQMRCFGAHTVPRQVSGDPTRLRQVINNLISNAVKFTPAGSITIRLAYAEDRLQLAIEDTGPGFGDKDPEQVFRPFDQLEADMARRHGGFGLGLAISRKLARLMGGDLTACNRRGGGARFDFIIPLPQVEAAPEAAREAPLRVLVVDDHSINRETMKLLLEPLGVTPVMADGGVAALEALATQPFDLVLMDINMPGMDGREATRRLRASAGVNRAIPVIAVSAADAPREWRACAESGMNAHVAKPIRPHRLYEAINVALAEQATPEMAASA